MHNLASISKRFLALFFESLIVMWLLVIPMILGFTGQIIGSENVMVFGVLVPLIVWVITIVITLRKWAKGTSIGKDVFDIIVINADSNKPLNFGRMLLRETIGKLLSSILCIGYFIGIIDNEKRTLHDRLVHSRVVMGQSGRRMKKRAIGVLVFLSLATLVLIFITPSLIAYASIRIPFTMENAPEAYATLEYREIIPLGDMESGVKLEYDGMKVLSPWGESSEIKEFNQALMFTFENGNSIVLEENYKFSMVEELKREFESEEDIERLEKLYGKENLSSEFMLLKAEMNMTPDQVSIFMPEEEWVISATLLAMKSLLPISAEYDNYYFDDGKMNGFIFERKNLIIVWAYDEEGYHRQIMLIGERISDEDLDFVVSSVKFFETEDDGE